MKIAVLGAAFDPPTLGHADVIRQCLATFDEVWLVPAFSHAFSKQMSLYLHRCQMTQVFISDMAEPKLKLMACEDKIKHDLDKPVYSLDLMRYLKQQQPQHSYALVIGPDNLKVFDSFYQSDVLKTEFKPFVAKQRLDIRSTKVRDSIQQGLPVNELTTASVIHYIHLHNLYSTGI